MYRDIYTCMYKNARLCTHNTSRNRVHATSSISILKCTLSHAQSYTSLLQWYIIVFHRICSRSELRSAFGLCKWLYLALYFCTLAEWAAAVRIYTCLRWFSTFLYRLRLLTHLFLDFGWSFKWRRKTIQTQTHTHMHLYVYKCICGRGDMWIWNFLTFSSNVSTYLHDFDMAMWFCAMFFVLLILVSFQIFFCLLLCGIIFIYAKAWL